MKKELTCPCNYCKEKLKTKEPKFLIRTPPKKRKSPAEVFFWTLLFFGALGFIAYLFWT